MVPPMVPAIVTRVVSSAVLLATVKSPVMLPFCVTYWCRAEIRGDIGADGGSICDRNVVVAVAPIVDQLFADAAGDRRCIGAAAEVKPDRFGDCAARWQIHGIGAVACRDLEIAVDCAGRGEGIVATAESSIDAVVDDACRSERNGIDAAAAGHSESADFAVDGQTVVSATKLDIGSAGDTGIDLHRVVATATTVIELARGAARQFKRIGATAKVGVDGVDRLRSQVDSDRVIRAVRSLLEIDAMFPVTPVRVVASAMVTPLSVTV